MKASEQRKDRLTNTLLSFFFQLAKAGVLCTERQREREREKERDFYVSGKTCLPLSMGTGWQYVPTISDVCLTDILF